MVRKTRKPAVPPEVGRQWLKRAEENGESPPHIAKTDVYDVRTVRKVIQLAREEREAREARSMVLRQALEKHYADLVSFAEKLNREIVFSSLPMGARNDRLWAALRDHLPRSPLWKAIDRMERLNDEVSAIEKRAEERLQGEVEQKGPLGFTPKAGRPGFNLAGLSGAMGYHLRAPEGSQPQEFQEVSRIEGLTELAYGNWNCAMVSADQLAKVKRFISELMADVSHWPEYEEMKRTVAERQRVIDAIREELAIITLRRVVPGRCPYCPI